jgi:putative redox protein
MNARAVPHLLLVTFMLMLALLLTACQQFVQSVPVSSTPVVEAAQPATEGPQLATAKVSAQLSNQPGQAIVSARGNHFVVGSMLPLEGPHEELNPIDMLLAAQATCGIFVVERAAQEFDVPLSGAAATVEGDFDARGVSGEPVDSRIQMVRVHLNLPGTNDDQVKQLIAQFTQRCPIYSTLFRAVPIEITTGEEVATQKTEGLATAMVSAKLSNQFGRAIVSVRGKQFVIDSVPPLKGPNEEPNPLDLMLGALAACGNFVYETVAQEQNIPLAGVTVNVEGDFDPRGVAGEPVNPRLQAIRVYVKLVGADEAQAEMMTEQFQNRCPVFTTLKRSAPIEISTEL